MKDKNLKLEIENDLKKMNFDWPAENIGKPRRSKSFAAKYFKTSISKIVKPIQMNPTHYQYNLELFVQLRHCHIESESFDFKILTCSNESFTNLYIFHPTFLFLIKSNFLIIFRILFELNILIELLCRSFQSLIALIGHPWSIRKLNKNSKLCTVSIILEGVSCFLFRLKSDSFQSRLFFSHWGLWLFAQFHDWGDRSVFGGVHDCSWFVYPFKSLKSIRKWPDSIPHRTIQ